MRKIAKQKNYKKHWWTWKNTNKMMKENVKKVWRWMKMENYEQKKWRKLSKKVWKIRKWCLPSVLIPGFHLSVCEIEASGQFHTILYTQVFLSFETSLQTVQLVVGKCRPRFSRLLHLQSRRWTLWRWDVVVGGWKWEKSFEKIPRNWSTIFQQNLDNFRTIRQRVSRWKIIIKGLGAKKLFAKLLKQLPKPLKIYRLLQIKWIYALEYIINNS